MVADFQQPFSDNQPDRGITLSQQFELHRIKAEMERAPKQLLVECLVEQERQNRVRLRILTDWKSQNRDIPRLNKDSFTLPTEALFTLQVQALAVDKMSQEELKAQLEEAIIQSYVISNKYKAKANA